MNATLTVLSQMVEQFRQRHKRQPEKLVVAPLASLALAAKGSLAPRWEGIPVVCRDIKEEEATSEPALARSLAVFLKPEQQRGWLVCCDLKT